VPLILAAVPKCKALLLNRMIYRICKTTFKKTTFKFSTRQRLTTCAESNFQKFQIVLLGIRACLLGCSYYGFSAGFLAPLLLSF
jgi:hypothetical protein